MHWQDYVFAVGSFFLIVTLIPMLRAAHKPPLHSSLPIAAILYVFAFTYGTLGFALAPVIEFVQGSLWLWLGWQRVREVQQQRKYRTLYDTGASISGVRVVTSKYAPSGKMFLLDPKTVHPTLIVKNLDQLKGSAFDD